MFKDTATVEKNEEDSSSTSSGDDQNKLKIAGHTFELGKDE